MRAAPLSVALTCLAATGGTLRAQSELPSSYGDLVACGAFWLYPQTDSTVRLRRVRDGACGHAEVIVAITSASHTGVAISVRARSRREALRLPLRFFIDLDSIAVFRHAARKPERFATLYQLVSKGDVSNQSSLEVLDDWRTHMWRLSDAPPDSSRIAVLARDGTTLPRTISVVFGSDEQRPDSMFVPFRLQGQRPAAPLPAKPQPFSPTTQLAGIGLVSDTTLFPFPFYAGIAVVRFSPGAGPLSRQLVMDRLQGRVIAARPGPGREPDLIVQVGAAWKDSLTQHHPQRKLSREVVRFGYLLREQDVSMVRPAKPAVDSTVIDAHYDTSCRLRADREPHRRLAMVFLADASPGERLQVANLFGGRWLPSEEKDAFYERLEMIGTRDEVSRQLSLMQRLPQVSSARLNHYLDFSGRPVCP